MIDWPPTIALALILVVWARWLAPEFITATKHVLRGKDDGS